MAKIDYLDGFPSRSPQGCIPESLEKITRKYIELAIQMKPSRSHAQKTQDILEMALYDEKLEQLIEGADCLLIELDYLDQSLRELNFIKAEELKIQDFAEIVRKIKISSDLIDYLSNFDDACFQRTLIYRSQCCSVYIVCFKPDQSTDIHHHGDSLDVICTYRGQLAHSIYLEKESSSLINKESVDPGGYTVVDAYQYHQLSNEGNQDLVTVSFRFESCPFSERIMPEDESNPPIKSDPVDFLATSLIGKVNPSHCPSNRPS